MKNKLILAIRLENLAKHRFSLSSLTPYDQHRVGADAIIQARRLRQDSIIEAIQTHRKLPTLFSNFKVPKHLYASNSELYSKLISRHARDNWIHSINNNLQLGYTTSI